MKKRKIVHIGRRAYDSYFPSKDSPYYYLAGWSSAVARQTLKYTDRYTIENWRPEREVNKPVTREVQGIMCRLFPAVSIKSFGDWSLSMLKELASQTKEYEILIHHSSIHSYSLYVIASIFKDTPIVAQHHGDSPLSVRYNNKRKLRTLVSRFIEGKSLRYVDHFFVLRKSEMDYLSKYVSKSRLTLQTMGVDFDDFRPIDKMLARRQLGLPADKKVMLYVGKFYRLKGVDIILSVFEELKQKHSLELVLIGGFSSNELYDEVRSSGARFFGYLPHNELAAYFSAADIYLLPAFSKAYAGIDVAAIESLACNVPVVSTTLEDFPTEEWQKLGKTPKNKSDVVECVSEIFENPSHYRSCREVAKKYYEWKRIISNTTKIYDMLFDKYYGRRNTKDGV